MMGNGPKSYSSSTIFFAVTTFFALRHLTAMDALNEGTPAGIPNAEQAEQSGRKKSTWWRLTIGRRRNHRRGKEEVPSKDVLSDLPAMFLVVPLEKQPNIEAIPGHAPDHILEPFFLCGVNSAPENSMNKFQRENGKVGSNLASILRGIQADDLEEVKLGVDVWRDSFLCSSLGLGTKGSDGDSRLATGRRGQAGSSEMPCTHSGHEEYALSKPAVYFRIDALSEPEGSPWVYKPAKVLLEGARVYRPRIPWDLQRPNLDINKSAAKQIEATLDLASEYSDLGIPTSFRSKIATELSRFSGVLQNEMSQRESGLQQDAYSANPLSTMSSGH